MRVKRTPEEISALVAEVEATIKSEIFEIRPDRTTPSKQKARESDIRQRARNLVNHCLARPVTAND